MVRYSLAGLADLRFTADLGFGNAPVQPSVAVSLVLTSPSDEYVVAITARQDVVPRPPDDHGVRVF